MTLVTSRALLEVTELEVSELGFSEAHAERYTPPRLLSPAQREALSRSIAPRVLSVVRRATLPEGVHSPSDLASVGRGLRLGARIVLTASEWIMPRPNERAVQLSARCAHLSHSSASLPTASTSSTRSSTGSPQLSTRSDIAQSDIEQSDIIRSDTSAYILEHNRAEGWALLKLEAPLSCSPRSSGSSRSMRPGETRESKHEHARAQGDLERELNDQALYVFEPPPRAPAQVILSGQGAGIFEFYRVVSGHLAPGEPLFSDSGRWVSISSGLSRSALDVQLGVYLSLILPKNALESALERASLYLE